jgi:anaerobic ribonucleoside-triphosphate reductase activating protein
MIAPPDLTIPMIELASPPERVTIARHSGPGLRLILWVQGCSLLCTQRCLNPHLLRHGGGYRVPPSRLTRVLLNYAEEFGELEGVTVLGGEPFDQAGPLTTALAPVRARGLSILVYTGQVMEDLQAKNDDGVNRLLAICDILIDGPFLDALYDESLIWRGSSNQRILLLSDHYSEGDIERALAAQKRAAAISVGARGDVAVSGAQNPAAARQLRQLTKLTKSVSPENLSPGGMKR